MKEQDTIFERSWGKRTLEIIREKGKQIKGLIHETQVKNRILRKQEKQWGENAWDSP